jgi:Calcineurin-like phosphoesterase
VRRSAVALAASTAFALIACQQAAPGHDGGSRPQTPRPLGQDGEHPPPGPAIRYVVGGDSREDTAHVLPWALHETRTRGVAALIFLGDMESRPELDDHFRGELAELGPVPFLPVLGNHETVLRDHTTAAPRDDRVRALQAYGARFLGRPPTPVQSAFDDKLTYAVDLPGGVHFIALDNVSQPGFGADQLAWLAADLQRARADGRARHLVVGMHKALVGSGVTRHAMDEDGPAAAADSTAALALLEQNHVELIVASHFHGFAEYAQGGIRSFITGGLGAPLDVVHGKEPAFHHLLVVTVPPEAAGAPSPPTPLAVEVIRFPGTPAIEREEER